MKTTAIGIRLPNHLLDKVEEYGLENFPKGDSYDKTATIIELISKGLGFDGVEQPVKQDVSQEIEAIKKRLTLLEAKFVEQTVEQVVEQTVEQIVEQVVRQNSSHENEPEPSQTEEDNESIEKEISKRSATRRADKEEISPLYSEDDLMKMETDELREIAISFGESPNKVKKLYKKALVKDILKTQKPYQPDSQYFPPQQHPAT